MPGYDGHYAIVLDRWLEEEPDHWPLTEVRSTLEEARGVDHYGGDNPATVPRSAYRAVTVEPTELLNTRTRASESGAIRRLEARSDG